MSLHLHPTPQSLPSWHPAPTDAGHAHAWSARTTSGQQGRAAQACAGLRRLAAPWLTGGASLVQTARTLGISPGRLAAAHATVFDPSQSPLKARRLQRPAAALRALLAAQVPLQWQAPAQGALPSPRQHLTLDGAALRLHAAPDLQACAVQLGDALPTLMWFDRRGEPEWVWSPGEHQGPLLAALVRRWGSQDLRAGLPASGDDTPARPAGPTLRAPTRLPPGAAWDLLLHAAAQGLPLTVQAGGAATLRWHGRLRRALLDGRCLRVEADGLRLSLPESAPVWLCAPGLAPAPAGDLHLGVSPDPRGGRSQACAWWSAVAVVQGERPEVACTC